MMMTAKVLNRPNTQTNLPQIASQAPEQVFTTLTATNQISLPIDGYSRASQLMPFLPIGESTLWKWAKTGQFPAPIKLSPTVTAWRNADVHQWFAEQASKIDSSAPYTPADNSNINGVA